MPKTKHIYLSILISVVLFSGLVLNLYHDIKKADFVNLSISIYLIFLICSLVLVDVLFVILRVLKKIENGGVLVYSFIGTFNIFQFAAIQILNSHNEGGPNNKLALFSVLPLVIGILIFFDIFIFLKK